MHVHVPGPGDVEMNKFLTSGSSQSSIEKQPQTAHLSYTWCRETGKERAERWASDGGG